MNPRFNLSRSYYEIIKANHWPCYDFFLDLDIESAEIHDLGIGVKQELQNYIEQEPKYHFSLFPYFTVKFPGLDLVKEHFSQSWQDLFVLSVLQGKTNGTFLEIGAGWPVLNSNTYLLTQFGYTGLSIDIDIFQVEPDWKNVRPTCRFIKKNATDIDYRSLLEYYKFPAVIDYLQIDIDPEDSNLEVLYKIPFDTYKFRVVTFETDLYKGNSKIQVESQMYLKKHGYKLLIENVATKNWETNSWEPFEDWYVLEELADTDSCKKLFSAGQRTKLPHEIFVKG